MKVFSSSSEFNYSWDEVSTNNWRKYSPWNPKTPHVVAVDTLSQSVDNATGILRTERLITCKQSSPTWLKPILGGADSSLIYETSYVDPRTRTLTMCSHNLSWTELITVRETVQYTPLSGAPGAKTHFAQRAEITALCGGWQKIRNKIEGFCVDRFSQNAAKGREGFEIVLARAREVFREERERKAQEMQMAKM